MPIQIPSTIHDHYSKYYFCEKNARSPSYFSSIRRRSPTSCQQRPIPRVVRSLAMNVAERRCRPDCPNLLHQYCFCCCYCCWSAELLHLPRYQKGAFRGPKLASHLCRVGAIAEAEKISWMRFGEAEAMKRENAKDQDYCCVVSSEGERGLCLFQKVMENFSSSCAQIED